MEPRWARLYRAGPAPKPGIHVRHWLRAGAGVNGYAGFAVGRSIFADVVRSFASDPAGYDLHRGVEEISARYRRFIAVYEEAERVAPPVHGGS